MIATFDPGFSFAVLLGGVVVGFLIGAFMSYINRPRRDR